MSRPRTPAADAPLFTAWTSGFHPFLPGVGFAILGILSCLYLWCQPLYFAVMDAWMAQPFPRPFIDIEFMPASITCWNAGVDVYAANPCDRLGRVYNYSPLWLRLGFLATDPRWNAVWGLVCIGFYLLSLGWLPPPRHRAGRGLMLAAAFSYASLFAMERTNIDLLMFVLAAATASCLSRHSLMSRSAGYAAILLAAALKFYPATLLVLLARERLKHALPAGLAALAAMAGFVSLFHVELARIPPLIPCGAVFGDVWWIGSSPRGIAALWPPFATTSGSLAPALLAAMIVTAAVWMARGRGFTAALQDVPDRARIFPWTGAALVCGCFFTGPSLPYRAIHLLFAFPVLLTLAHRAPTPGARRLFGSAIAAMLYVLWELPIRRLVTRVFGGAFETEALSAPIAAAWLVQELAWLWIIILLLAIQMRFLLEARAWRECTGEGGRGVNRASRPRP